MAPIFTQRLFANSISAIVFEDVYTVPTGNTIVLRDLELFVDPPQTVQFLLNRTWTIWNYESDATGGVAWAQWQGRVAAVAGDTINVATTTANLARFIGTGYLFVA